MNDFISSVTIPVTGTYQIDPASSVITFRGRHFFGLGRVAGRFDIRSGSVVVAVPVSASLVAVSVEAASFVTGHPRRDPHVRSADFLDVQNYPEILFSSTGAQENEDGWVVSGEITARGVVAPVQLSVLEVMVDGDIVRMRASARIDRYAHGITKLKGMAGRYLDLDITALAVRQEVWADEV